MNVNEYTIVKRATGRLIIAAVVAAIIGTSLAWVWIINPLIDLIGRM